MKNVCRAILLCLFCLVMPGCLGDPQNPAATQPVIDVPAEQATPQFWYQQPATATVSSTDFQKLWDACDRTARDYQFVIDRSDYRGGLLTTKPLVSKQIFEFWRHDVGSFHEVLRSTLQTMRRTIRFEVVRSDDGVFVAQPKVLIEKFALPERRVTTVSEYRQVLIPAGPIATVQTATGATLPTEYWYAVGRDDALERKLAKSVQDKLQ